METWEKAIKLHEFIKNYQPKTFREPIREFAHVPCVTEDDYILFEYGYKNKNLEELIYKQNKSGLGITIYHPFCKPYLIEAINAYFEKDSVELKERKCKYCGAITVRTAMGLCSKCCRFN